MNVAANAQDIVNAGKQVAEILVTSPAVQTMIRIAMTATRMNYVFALWLRYESCAHLSAGVASNRLLKTLLKFNIKFGGRRRVLMTGVS